MSAAHFSEIILWKFGASIWRKLMPKQHGQSNYCIQLFVAKNVPQPAKEHEFTKMEFNMFYRGQIFVGFEIFALSPFILPYNLYACFIQVQYDGSRCFCAFNILPRTTAIGLRLIRIR